MPRLFRQRPEVPLLLYYWRYFDLSVLRRCFPGQFRNDRTVQDYLLRWRAAGYIKSARPGYQHQQHLHSVTPATVAYLAEHYGYDFVATADATVSPTMIEHEREISHFQSDVYAAVRDRPDLSVPVWIRRFGVDQQSTLLYRESGGDRLLKPDLAFLLVRHMPDGRQRPLLHFVEVDRGTEDMTIVQRKLAKYRKWQEQQAPDTLRGWYEPYGEPRSSFRLLVVTRHREAAGDHFRQLVRWYTQALAARPHLPMYIATLADLAAHRRGGPSRIWHALFRFKQSWLQRVSTHRQVSQAYDFVADKLRTLEPRHTLLPPAE